MDVDLSQYKVGVVEDLELSGKLRICRVNIGLDDCITVVTSATNVRPGSRLAVATAGCTFIDEEGAVQTVRKMTIGGCSSDGIFCDSYMLGWAGGAKGVAAQMPDDFELGSAPPISKPRRKDEMATDSEQGANSTVVGLFEKKLTKEEKKKLAEERRNSRKALKSVKRTEIDADPDDEQGLEEDM